jgi:hypothetical protein
MIRISRRYLSALAAAVIVAATPAFGAEPASVIDSAETLAQACRSVERIVGSRSHKVKAFVTTNALLCLGYMQAMQDVATLVDENRQAVLGSCPDEQTTLIELIQAFLDYYGSHPDGASEKATIAVIKSFRIAYPCPPVGETARQRNLSLLPTEQQRTIGRLLNETSRK